MDLSNVVIASRDIEEIKDLKYIQNLNFQTLSKCDTEMGTYYNESSKDFKMIKDFVAGDQWKTVETKKPIQVYNYAGQVVYDLIQTYNKGVNDKKPKRTVNITKTYLQSLVANFAEVDPMPMAISEYDYNSDTELNDKLNLVIKNIFYEENNFDKLYEKVLYESFQYGYYFIQPVIDLDKSETATPIKLRLVSPEDIRYDSTAEDINECDFLKQKVKMRYWLIKQYWDYKSEDGKEPDDSEIVEIEQWWFRTKDNYNKTKWFNFTVYGQKWLKPIDEKGNFYPERLVYEYLPLVMVKPLSTTDYQCQSLAAEIIPVNVQLNIALTEQDWNMMKWYNRPKKIIGAIDGDKVKGADIPGGEIAISQAGQDVQPYQVDLMQATEIEARQQYLKLQIKDSTGIDFDMLGGGKPKGTYSNNLMQTIQSKADNMLNMIQAHVFSSIEELTYKALYMQHRVMDGGSILLFNAKTQKKEVIYSDDLLNIKLTVNIDTKDINLLTRETKFQLLTQFMQYSQGNPILLYPMAQMSNNAIPHLFPDDTIKQFKTMYDMAIQNINNPPQQGEQGGVQQVPTLPVTEQTPVEESEDITDGVTNEQIINEWKNAEDRLKESGYSDKEINELYEELVVNKIADGTPRGEIIMSLEEAVNKSENNMKKK